MSFGLRSIDGPISLQELANNVSATPRSKKFFILKNNEVTNLRKDRQIDRQSQSAHFIKETCMEERKRQRQVAKQVMEELSDIFQREGYNIIDGGDPENDSGART